MRPPSPTAGRPSRLLLWTALGSVYVIWGSTYLGIKFAVLPEDGVPLPPMLMPALRFSVAGLLLFAFAARRPAADGRPDPLGWPQWRASAIVGAALLFGGNGLVTLAEQRGLDSGVAAVIVGSTPLWVALIGALRRDERLPTPAIFGLVIGFAGVAILVWPSSTGHIDTGDALLVVGASLSWACGSYYAKRAPMPRRPLVMTAMEMLCGAALFWLASGVSGELAEFDPAGVSARAWWALAYLIVFGAMVGFTAYVWLIRNASLSLATTYAYINPVVAVLLGALFADERITVRDGVATAVVVTAVALIVRTHRPAAPAGEEAGPAGLLPVETTQHEAGHEPAALRMGMPASQNGRTTSSPDGETNNPVGGGRNQRTRRSV
jgi:drug/metabolite transporter (DMT)-like permease